MECQKEVQSLHLHAHCTGFVGAVNQIKDRRVNGGAGVFGELCGAGAVALMIELRWSGQALGFQVSFRCRKG